MYCMSDYRFQLNQIIVPSFVVLFVVWIIFVIPTLAVAFDFVMISLMDKELLIDHVHYMATLLWVLAVRVFVLSFMT